MNLGDVLQLNKKYKECHVCQKNSHDDLIALKMCSGCRMVHYCGNDCQKKDWKRHKKECNKKIKCGICGNSKKGTFVKTECCGNWICNDEHKYQLGTYARNSCRRNHRRYTLCGTHFSDEHEGKHWKKCNKCLKGGANMEDVFWWATNEYNFDKLKNFPKFKRRRCDGGCKKILTGGSSFITKGNPSKYFCNECFGKNNPQYNMRMQQLMGGGGTSKITHFF